MKTDRQLLEIVRGNLAEAVDLIDDRDKASGLVFRLYERVLVHLREAVNPYQPKPTLSQELMKKSRTIHSTETAQAIVFLAAAIASLKEES